MEQKTKQTVKEQIALVVGKQEVICDCGKTMTIAVQRAKKNLQKGTYHPYKGSCRSCKAIYSGVIYTRKW